MVAALKRAGGTSPEGKLAGLKATRTELLGRVARLAAARQQLDAATDGERAAAAALAELDAVEIAAASKWASTGAVGAAPSGEIGRRTKLVANLASARAAAAAARGAGAGLDAELAALRARVAEADADIESAAFEVLELERQATHAELVEITARAGPMIAKLRAHHLSIGEAGRHRRDHDDPSGARRCFVEAERIGAIPLPDPQPDIDAARREWLQRFESLRG